MKKTLLTALLIAGAGSMSACDSFVSDVDPPVDLVPSDSLNTAANVPFLITGVQERFSTTHGAMVVLAEGLSDAYIFGYGTSGATFPTYIEVDTGLIEVDNNSVDGFYGDLNQLRFLADDLIDRAENQIQFAEDDAAIRARSLYNGYLYAGIARYMLATYIGLEPRRGGATIDAGPFIPSTQLYADAVTRFQTALTFVAEDSYEARLLNSMIARTYLYDGNTEQAGTFAARGLVSGDAPFSSLHSPQSNNQVWIGAGRGRTQFAAAPRFVADNNTLTPTETYSTVACGDTQYCAPGDTTYTYSRQALYLTDSDPIPFMSWQENNLMRAEATSGAAAVGFINAANGDDADVTESNPTVLSQQRDRILFSQGARLVDQRRFGQWHLGDNTWQYLPITQTERNSNPNI